MDLRSIHIPERMLMKEGHVRPGHKRYHQDKRKDGCDIELLRLRLSCDNRLGRARAVKGGGGALVLVESLVSVWVPLGGLVAAELVADLPAEIARVS